MANPEHLELLRQGVNAWNDWRAKNPSTSPNLTEADLYRTLLSGANFSHTNLTGTNLAEALLSGADLTGETLVALLRHQSTK